MSNIISYTRHISLLFLCILILCFSTGCSEKPSAVASAAPTENQKLRDNTPKILSTESLGTEILENETAGELFDRLAVIGAECMAEALEQLENGTITFTPQNHEEATVCKMLKKEQNKIDFSWAANKVKSFVLGLNPWPVAECNLKEGRLKVYKVQVVTTEQIEKLNLTKDYAVGEVVLASNKLGLIVKCAEGFVELTEIQAENGKVMSAKSLLNGKQILVGQIANE